MPNTIIFVHGWSVTSFDTYGQLPVMLAKEAKKRGAGVRIEEIFLGRYISFSDDVTLQDVSKAFDKALGERDNADRFVCITHSTGGPVIRDWLSRYHNSHKNTLAHLIMLAPANFGSTLAQLGKSRVSRLKNWFGGIEPGQKILDWLELGSVDSWKLNEAWIRTSYHDITNYRYFPFVLTGQSIDRKLYDNLNSYTGELGSDGVVRVSSANLNSRYIKIKQEKTTDAMGKTRVSNKLLTEEFVESYPIPMRLIPGKSHSGSGMGILASSGTENMETINAIFECMAVADMEQYNALRMKFQSETDAVHKKEFLEVERELLIMRRFFIHDRFSQIIFKVVDSEGQPVRDFDLLFTAGDSSDPNMLPAGFSTDRQQNKKNAETVTYYFNYDVMNGCNEVRYRNEVVRKECPQIKKLGLIIHPRPLNGFVRYSDCTIEATADLLEKVLHPDSTTLIEVVIQRIVSTEVFQFKEIDGVTMPSGSAASFIKTQPGSDII